MDELDYTNKFNTPLSKNEMPLYKKWAGDRIRDTYDYDLQGMWLNNKQFGDNGHGTDQFKKPNHPTFSTQSQYSNDEHKGGEWSLNKGKDMFTPSPFNKSMHSKEKMADYWNFAEKDSGAILNYGE